MSCSASFSAVVAHDRATNSERADNRGGHLLARRQGRPGRRGEFAFKLAGREIGHLHGDHAAHFMFPKELWRELRAQGLIVEHPVFPGKVGLAARRIETEADVRDVIELLRLSYEHIAGRHGVPAQTA